MKNFGILKNFKRPYVYKKKSGSTAVLVVIYVDGIGGDIATIASH